MNATASNHPSVDDMTRDEAVSWWRATMGREPHRARELIVELHRTGAHPAAIAEALRDVNWPAGDR